ncbi:MAG: hypothetical protein LBK73_04685 [Treponema sp.]|jgi:hypothetical protein|nr:hypothetical protein [Treponema sp.]
MVVLGTFARGQCPPPPPLVKPRTYKSLKDNYISYSGKSAAQDIVPQGFLLPHNRDVFGLKARAYDLKDVAYDSKADPYDLKSIPYDSKATDFDSKADPYDLKAIPFDSKATAFDSQAIPFNLKATASNSEAMTYIFRITQEEIDNG